MRLLRDCVTLIGMAAAVGAALLTPFAASIAQPAPAMERVPDRQPGEGEGPYRRLVIRGATMIEGSGAPPRGPVDIVVAGNRIESIRSAGTPGLPMRDGREPQGADREIDARGMVVLPGFVDVHGHNGDPDKAPNPTYGYRLWLAHGVTSVRGVGLYGGPNNPSLSDRARSAANAIVRRGCSLIARSGIAGRTGRCAAPSRAVRGCAGSPPTAMTGSSCSTASRPR